MSGQPYAKGEKIRPVSILSQGIIISYLLAWKNILLFRIYIPLELTPKNYGPILKNRGVIPVRHKAEFRAEALDAKPAIKQDFLISY